MLYPSTLKNGQAHYQRPFLNQSFRKSVNSYVNTNRGKCSIPKGCPVSNYNTFHHATLHKDQESIVI